MLYLKSKAGFGLIEVSITLLLLGFISMAVNQLIVTSNKSPKSVQNSLDFEILKSSIVKILEVDSLCSVGLRNLDNTAAAKFNLVAPPNALTQDVKLGSIIVGNTIVTKVGQVLGGGLTLTKLEFRDTNVPPTVNAGAGTTSYMVNLIVEAANNTGKTFTNSSNPFFLTLLTDTATSSVRGCKANNTIAAPVLTCTTVTNTTFGTPESTPTNPKFWQIVATCPANTTVVGGGCSNGTSGGMTGEPYISGSFPTHSPQEGWLCTRGQFPANFPFISQVGLFSLWVYAICCSI